MLGWMLQICKKQFAYCDQFVITKNVPGCDEYVEEHWRAGLKHDKQDALVQVDVFEHMCGLIPSMSGMHLLPQRKLPC